LERVGELLDVGGGGHLLDHPVRLVRRDQVDAPLRAPVVVPAADEIGGPVVRDQPRDEVEKSPYRVDGGSVGRLDLRDAVEGAEVHRRRVEQHQAAGLRAGHAPHPAMPDRYPHRVTQPDVEGTDQKILELLARDGRMSFTDLGKATGLSTSAVHQRVKRLEQRGLILGYGATVNHDQLGLPLTAFISIRPIDPSEPDDYPDRLRSVLEIESCWSVAGDESYILKVRVATPSALEDLLARIRSAANVSSRTTIVLSTPYENRPVSE